MFSSKTSENFEKLLKRLLNHFMLLVSFLPVESTHWKMNLALSFVAKRLGSEWAKCRIYSPWQNVLPYILSIFDIFNLKFAVFIDELQQGQKQKFSIRSEIVPEQMLVDKENFSVLCHEMTLNSFVSIKINLKSIFTACNVLSIDTVKKCCR